MSSRQSQPDLCRALAGEFGVGGRQLDEDRAAGQALRYLAYGPAATEAVKNYSRDRF